MSIMTLVNKIAKEECWAYETYEEWANDGLVQDPDDFTIGFFCLIDSYPIGEEK